MLQRPLIEDTDEGGRGRAGKGGVALGANWPEALWGANTGSKDRVWQLRLSGPEWVSRKSSPCQGEQMTY
jgi:hypothetical protein